LNLSLGTAQFGLPYGVANQNGQIPYREAEKIIQFAEDNSIPYLDTAIAYGISETVLGEIGVANFKITSKLPQFPNNERVDSWIERLVESSLNRLKLNQLDSLLLHRSNDLLSDYGEDAIETLNRLKQSGLIANFGISIYSVSEIEECLSRYDFDTVQAPLNLIDRSLIQSGWMDKLKQKKIQIHTRSVFLQGLLLMDPSTRPKKFNKWNKIWEVWDGYIQNSKSKRLDVCLNFIKTIDGIDRVIVGVDSLTHIKEIFTSYISPNKLEISELIYMNSEDTDLINPSHWNQL
jgi:hypothetical protein